MALVFTAAFTPASYLSALNLLTNEKSAADCFVNSEIHMFHIVVYVRIFSQISPQPVGWGGGDIHSVDILRKDGL